MPGRCAAPPAPAMITRSPRPAAAAPYVDHLAGRAVRGDDVDLVRHAELAERVGRGLHHRPVGVASP